MKWDKILRNIAADVRAAVLHMTGDTIGIILADLVASYYQVLRDEGKTHREAVEIYADKAYDHVMEWDIRACGRLRDLFPQFWPKSLMGELVAEYDDDGDWALYRKVL